MTVKATPSSQASSLLGRARRFLEKPLHEQSRAFYARWKKILPSVPFPVRLPFGAWFVARNDGLGSTLTYDGFETEERSFVEHFLRPGMMVLDIGAHHGFYTLLASKRVGPTGRVLAFEPSPREQQALRLNLKLNRCKNVSIQGLALGDEETEGSLFLVRGSETGFNSLKPPETRNPTTPVRVRIRRLDNVLRDAKIDRADLIKLDVEGGELGVLQGATDLLERRPRPVILVEVEDVRTVAWGYRAKEILFHLHGKGYKWFSLLAGGEIAELNMNADNFEGNFVACPPERESEIAEMIEHGPRS